MHWKFNKLWRKEPNLHNLSQCIHLIMCLYINLSIQFAIYLYLNLQFIYTHALTDGGLFVQQKLVPSFTFVQMCL